MIRVRRVWFCSILLTGFAVSSPDGPARADEASRLADAREIVVTTHAADNLRALLPTLLQQLRPLLARQGADQATVDALLGKMQSKMDGQTDHLVDLAAQVYAREFSDEDLDALLAFYRTPAGQHLIAKQKEIMQGMLALGQQFGQILAREVLEEFAREHSTPAPKL